MNSDRPYQYVSTFALVVLIEIYDKKIQEGNFKLQRDFDLMYEEFERRLEIKKEEDKQISIEEYMRSRKDERS